MAYTLEFYGHTWQGYRSVYAYTLAAPIATDAEALRAAGDFQSVIDWRLVETQSTMKRHGRESCRTFCQRTIRGFRHGMTPQRFASLAYGEG